MKTTFKTLQETKLAIESVDGQILELYRTLDNPVGSESYRELSNTLRMFKNEASYLEKREIKPFVNRHGYSDVDPYEVIKVVSDKTVEVRKMDTVQIRVPNDFHSGGFLGHFSDNRDGQEYEYSSNEENETIRVRWSERNRRWQDGNGNRFVMSDKPYKFYDYNF